MYTEPELRSVYFVDTNIFFEDYQKARAYIKNKEISAYITKHIGEDVPVETIINLLEQEYNITKK